MDTCTAFMRGCVCLPARKLDSSLNPCVLRMSAVLVCTSGDLLLWTSTTSLGCLNPLHSLLVIRSASCSSARTGERGEERQGGQSHISTHKPDKAYHTQRHRSGVRGAQGCDGLANQGTNRRWGITCIRRGPTLARNTVTGTGQQCYYHREQAQTSTEWVYVCTVYQIHCMHTLCIVAHSGMLQ